MQFLSNGPKTGKTLDTYFGIDDSKKHLYNAEVGIWATLKASNGSRH